MQDTGAWLIAFAIVAFGIGLVAGLLFRRSRVWDWADPVYYAVGVAGVVLLFLSNERTRVLADAQVELTTAQQQLNELSANAPGLPEAAAYLDWQKRKADQEVYVANIKGQIKTMSQQEEKSSLQNVLDFVIGHFWPFVLTIALAVKFARGVATLCR